MQHNTQHSLSSRATEGSKNTKALEIKEGKKERDPENYRPVKQKLKPCELIKAVIRELMGFPYTWKVKIITSF